MNIVPEDSYSRLSRIYLILSLILPFHLQNTNIYAHPRHSQTQSHCSSKEDFIISICSNISIVIRSPRLGATTKVSFLQRPHILSLHFSSILNFPCAQKFLGFSFISNHFLKMPWLPQRLGTPKTSPATGWLYFLPLLHPLSFPQTWRFFLYPTLMCPASYPAIG